MKEEGGQKKKNDSVPAPNLRFPLPSLTYLHMEIGEGGGLVRWGGKGLKNGPSIFSLFMYPLFFHLT